MLFNFYFSNKSDSFFSKIYSTSPLLTCLILLLLIVNSIAQNSELRFKHLTTDEGLSQNIVNCIYQDSRGFMWFGTNDGLNKYDGYEFTVYNLDGDEGQTLSDNWIKSLTEDSEGNLWIGTGNGGINIFNGTLNEFRQLKEDSSYNFNPGSNNVEDIIEDSKKNIWFVTAQTINKIDKETNIITRYDSSNFNNAQFSNNSLNIILEDRDNKFWIGSNGGGLVCFDPELETFEYFEHSKNDENSISNNSIISLYEDSEKNLWIGTYNGGLNFFDRKNKSFRTFIPNTKVRESYTIKSISDDKNGNLWIGTRNGLYIFNKKTHRFIQYAHDDNNPNSISNNNVQVIYSDVKGNFWLGTKRGVNFFNIENMQFNHYRADATNNRYLNHSFVTAIYEDNNNVWFATGEKGLNQLDKKSGIFNYYTHNPNDINSISSNNINAITENEDGNLWIGTFQGGLNFFDRKTNRFFHYKLSPNQPLIYQDGISSLLFSSNNILWVGTGNGLKIFNRDKKTFKVFSLIDSNPSENISCIFEDSENNIWVGGNTSRLYKINPLSNEQESYKLPTGSELSIINTIVEDEQILWIGTAGGGLFAFNKTEKSFKQFTKKNGLPDNTIQSLLIDKQNNIWIGTFNGLSKYNIKTKKFINYYKENGLQNNQFTGAHFKTSEGKFYLGNIDGAISFFPEKIPEELTIPTVTFIDFKVLNRLVPIGGDNPILTSHISEAQNVSLSYEHTSFTFTFAALDYAMSDNIKYAYMMKGFDKDWNYVGNRRYATYTNLNPGKYTFTVKAANNAGQWSTIDASVNISISPPYWDTLWFKLVIISVLLLGLLHFINYQRQKRNLLKATSLANLTQLKLLRNQMNPHFLLNAFSAIRALVLIDKNRAWEMISELSEYFRYVLLNYRREKDTLNEEIDAARNYIGIQKNCFHDTLDVTYEVDDEARELIVPAFIFQPLIENAIKYGSQTSAEEFKIRLLITYVNGVLLINISNTGGLRKWDDGIKRDKVHGNSIENIKKRLSIMFKDKFSFKIYEKEGWVIASIKIDYAESIKAKAELHADTGLLEEAK
ncbi:MAG: histidine kinase [Melioribacteraceae bacterium]|nr:histidine kinase [Melioribacteraceae bacterium]